MSVFYWVPRSGRGSPAVTRGARSSESADVRTVADQAPEQRGLPFPSQGVAPSRAVATLCRAIPAKLVHRAPSLSGRGRERVNGTGIPAGYLLKRVVCVLWAETALDTPILPCGVPCYRYRRLCRARQSGLNTFDVAAATITATRTRRRTPDPPRSTPAPSRASAAKPSLCTTSSCAPRDAPDPHPLRVRHNMHKRWFVTSTVEFLRDHDAQRPRHSPAPVVQRLLRSWHYRSGSATPDSPPVGFFAMIQMKRTR